MEKKERIKNYIILGSIFFFCFVCVPFFLLRYMSPEEKALRKEVVAIAESYLGCSEADGSHQTIIDYYNEQDFLPRGYEVTYEDSWCAAFVTTVGLQSKAADWMSPECSCEQMITLMDRNGDWEEWDWYIPQTGDLIFYDWEGRWFGDNKGWSDHVGIVVGVYGPVIKVIEGNLEDAVGYHYVFINHPHIRGYGLPDYRKCVACS